MLELRAIFKGRVQGVGFRWTVVERGERFGLTGFVKNLSNGSVEVIAQGKQTDLEAFIKNLKEDPDGARIESVQQEFREMIEKYHSFTIKHE
jgi:acylphosphatase